MFSSPANNTFGNAPRNGSIDGPRYINLDATLAKLFTLPRSIKGEFRVDIFNITNTPHFNNPERHVPRLDVRADHEHDRRQRAVDALRVQDDVLIGRT